MLSCPIECPGATVPPAFTVSPPRVPLPISVPPLSVTAPTVPSTENVPPCTVNGELGSAAPAATFSVPCCTVHGSTPLLTPVSVQVALSTLAKLLKNWYFGPISPTLNVSLPLLPPS